MASRYGYKQGREGGLGILLKEMKRGSCKSKRRFVRGGGVGFALINKQNRQINFQPHSTEPHSTASILNPLHTHTHMC